MMEELIAASELLNEALERYLSVCTTIHSSCVREDWLQVNGTLRDLADHVANELGLVVAYENKLKTARIAISQARDYCSTIAPINSLPDELLTRIFDLVHGSQPWPCTAKKSWNKSKDVLFPEYPDLLSYVCSRWRRVSTNSRVLWSHIDLAPCNHPHDGLVNRAEMCANRAGDLPLYVHVICLQHQFKWTKAYHAFEQFLESVSTRIKSLALPTGTLDELTDIRILDTCFQKCRPGVLTELTITDHLESGGFIWPSGKDPVSGGLQLESSYKFLENLWHHVTVLRLHGLFPYWTSKAYHGLVELRLTASSRDVILIPESQLVTMISSSPQLRTLHFEIQITNQLPENASITPVCLDDLRAMALTFYNYDQVGVFLRWLALGSMPLELSIAVHSQLEQFLPNNNVKGFFARSMITRFRLLETHISCQEVVELLDRLPYLQVLALAYSTCRLDLIQANAPEPHPGERNVSGMPTRLARLYLLRCHSDIDSLRWLIEKRSTPMLTLWDCTVAQDMEIQAIPGIYDSPLVEIIAGSKPNPCNDWY